MIDNKYKRLYFKIISAKKTKLGYTEIHHIVPRSLGGSNNSSNLVKLTAREHFLCHYLLTKMYRIGTVEWHKMIKAFSIMRASALTQHRYINSRLYSSIREQMSIVMSASQSGENNSQYGTIWITNGVSNIKINSHDLTRYESNGFRQGRTTTYTQYLYPKIDKQLLRIREEYITLKPFFDRYKHGESLRDLAKDYGKSHVSLYNRLNKVFGSEINFITPCSQNRK